MADQRTVVLLHGASHGGWRWTCVADILRAAGHRVMTPTQTQTGLGERDWGRRDIATACDAMVSAPRELAVMLTEIVR